MDSDATAMICLSLLLTLLYAVPSIIYIFFGLKYQGTICVKEAVAEKAESPTWLIVKGAVGILQAFTIIGLVIAYFRCKTDECFAFSMLVVALLLLTFLFEFAWLIYGGVVFFNDRDCQKENNNEILNKIFIFALTLGICLSIYGLDKFIFSDNIRNSLFKLHGQIVKKKLRQVDKN